MTDTPPLTQSQALSLLANVDRRGFTRALALPAFATALASCGSSDGSGTAAAQSTGQPDAEALRSQLEPRYRFYEASFDQKQADAFVADFYTDDIVAVSEGQGFASGKPEMLQLVRNLMRDMKRIRVTWHQPYPLGPDAAFDLVQNEVLPEGGSAQVDQYKSLLIWRRTNAVWRVAADFYAPGNYKG